MVQPFKKRPTSPLLYEPLYTPPEGILYPGSDEEATPDEREKKRIRVEVQGQQYLNGRPLFIQSASLRGPFEKGWVNPWQSNERKHGVDIRRFPQASEEAQVGTIGFATTDLRAGTVDLVNDLPSNVRERSLSKTDRITRNGYDEVKRLSQQGIRLAKTVDGQLQAKKLSQEAVARAIKEDQKKTPSRLMPYVSEVVPGNDAASSAALVAAKAPKPKPSPHAVPSSTYQPEFQYHYARKRTSTSASPQRAPFVDAPEQPQARPRSDSSSSSGSSAFAEALEAAQEKAASKSFASSKSSSPATDGRETKVVKGSRQALRRLTFTPSGGAKLASARTSSRPSSRSSAAGPGKKDMEHRDKPPSDNPPSLVRTSTKSSAQSRSNGDRSRNSIIFPEAQTDPIAHPPIAQAPSGPSTDFLETGKQSPKVSGYDEGDSYLDLSTQAAVLKAQRSFQAEVVSALTPLRPKKEESSPIGFTSRKAEITSVSRGTRKAEAANAQLLRSSASDDEEPMSTQEMVDAISPFAVTTVKKRPPAVQKRISVIPSPTKKMKARYPLPAPNISPESPTTAIFRSHSPGMSTSPSPTPSPSPIKSPPPIPLSHPTTNSKPPSSLTSFSILPNGTLTETSLYQHDGQQQQDIPSYDISLPLDPFGFDGADGHGRGQRQGNAWDLGAAIEEAGNFLGEWDLEAEARREGRTSRRREEGNTNTGVS